MNSPEWKQIVVGIVSSIIQGALLPFYAILFAEYLKVLVKSDEDAKSTANLLAILFLVLGVAAGGTMFMQMFMFALAGESLTARLRRMTFHAMLKQEMAFYDDRNNNVGALCARLSGDAAHVQGATGSRIGTLA
jgi:ATP-binding cassette subfamily B (MDR/TAP) protein 1